MLNEEQLEYLPEGIAQRLETVNQHFLEMVGARIKEIGSMSATDIHRLEQMKAVGADVDKLTAELAAISGKNAAEIKEIFDIVANDDVQFSEKFLGTNYVPYKDNTALQRYVAALAAQSIADYVNMSHNTAFMTYQNGKKVLTSLSQAYTNVIDNAITAVTTGQTDFYSAMRGSLKRLADSGIRTKYSPLKGSVGKTVDYASGYSRRLDTAIRQNLLWGIKQCNQGVQEQVGAEFGSDGWEIDYHPHPRPSHAEMGGRQYAAGNKGKVVDGVYYPPFSDIEDLLADYGCLHRKWPILLGISEPNHSAEELEKLKADDEKKIEFEGEEYTKYELSQIQRKLETAARHAKDRQILAKAAGDDELRRQEQSKINLITSKYAKLSKAAGLPTRAERMSVSKYRRVKSSVELNAPSKYDIMAAEIKKETGLRGTFEINFNRTDTRYYSFDEEHIAKREHGVTREEVEHFIDIAPIRISRWNGRYMNYYSDQGAAYLDTEKGIIRTAFKSNEYDEKTRKLIEELKKHELL